MICYKCDTALENVAEDTVHPLCDDCNQSFTDWFDAELTKLSRK